MARVTRYDTGSAIFSRMSAYRVGRLAIVAYITDEVAISRILDHLGLSPAPQERPPPTRELVRVPVDEEGREIQAS